MFEAFDAEAASSFSATDRDRILTMLEAGGIDQFNAAVRRIGALAQRPLLRASSSAPSRSMPWTSSRGGITASSSSKTSAAPPT